MRQFFSSRISIAISIAVVIILIAVSYRISHSSSTTSATKKGKGIVINELVLASLDRDDDNDGLKNWEEELYKTDISKADTDGDGLTDNEEAILGQDPTVPDAITNSTSTASQQKVVFTPTDRLSQQILEKYVEAKQSGLPINDDISAQIAENILAQDYSDIKQAFTEQDIKKIDETVAGIKKYGNDLGRILQAPRTTKLMELEIFPKLATESVDSYKNDLLTLKNRYVKMRDAIIATPTPKPLAKAQSQIANSINIFIDAIDGALSLDADPIGSLTKVGRYTFGVQSLEAALLEVRAYLKSNRITYSTSESGYILLQ